MGHEGERTLAGMHVAATMAASGLVAAGPVHASITFKPASKVAGEGG
jgi:hypothetical protein